MAGLPLPSSIQQPLGRSVPKGNTYEAREVNIGRVQSQFSGGPQIKSGVGEGLKSLSGAIDKWTDVFEQQEQQKQTLEAMEETRAFKDKERIMLEQMEQMQGVDAESATDFAAAFYEKERQELTGKARGDFQKMIYEQAVNSDRESGLNRAFAHRRAEFQKYEASVFMGDQTQFMETASDWRSTPEDIERAAGPFLQRQAAYYQSKGLDPREAYIKANQTYKEGMRQNVIGRLAHTIKSGDADKAEEVFKSLKYGEQQRGDFSAPLDGNPRISSPFGSRVRPAAGATSDHKGVDYAVPVGTPVKSVAPGVVEFVGKNKGYGLQVRVKHDDGSVSWYSHLSQANGIKEGMAVERGQTVALSGGAKGDPNAGVSTGPHLDFKFMASGGQFVDPQKIVGGGGSSSASAIFSPAEIEGMRLQVVQARDDQSVKIMTADVASAYQNGTELEIESSINKGFIEIKNIGDPERQNSMKQSFMQNIEFQQKVRDAADMETTEKFLAETEGLSPLDRKKKFQEWEGFSRKARETLAKKIDEGMFNKVTPENQEAYDLIRVEIDDRRNAGKPMNDQEVKALAQRHGLTVDQAKGAEKYRTQGGLAGTEGFAGKVNAIYKELNRGSDNAPSGFLELVARNLPPGKTATPEELRRVVATLMISGIKGESVRWYWDTSETYNEAAKKGRGEIWLPKITDDEERAALSLEINAKIEAGEFPDNRVKEEDLRDYKRVFKMGLPPRPAKGR